MPRKRTFEDRKFSVGDSNSNAYRDNYDAIFRQPPSPTAPDETGDAEQVQVKGAVRYTESDQ